MNKRTRVDEAFELCRAARPVAPDGLLSPHSAAAQALLEEIMSMSMQTRSSETQHPATEEAMPRRSRTRTSVAILVSVAAATMAVVGAIAVTGRALDPSATTSTPRAASTNMVRIAASSQAAVEGSGRARVMFVLQKHTADEQTGTNEVAWSGPDLEMKVHIDGGAQRPPSDAWTKTVDGESYSFIGPKGQERHWVHEPTTSGSSGHELFDADPRTLLSILDPAAGFTEVGTERIGEVATRHLHATTPGKLPVVSLGLAPDATNTRVLSLDLWVGDDDVVRRLDLTLRRLDTKTAGGQPPARVTHDSTYSMIFSDLGTPIAITAPTDARPGAAKG